VGLVVNTGVTPYHHAVVLAGVAPAEKIAVNTTSLYRPKNGRRGRTA
jgi:hypothetical protein